MKEHTFTLKSENVEVTVSYESVKSFLLDFGLMRYSLNRLIHRHRQDDYEYISYYLVNKGFISNIEVKMEGDERTMFLYELILEAQARFVNLVGFSPGCVVDRGEKFVEGASNVLLLGSYNDVLDQFEDDEDLIYGCPAMDECGELVYIAPNVMNKDDVASKPKKGTYTFTSIVSDIYLTRYNFCNPEPVEVLHNVSLSAYELYKVKGLSIEERSVLFYVAVVKREKGEYVVEDRVYRYDIGNENITFPDESEWYKNEYGIKDGLLFIHLIIQILNEIKQGCYK